MAEVIREDPRRDTVVVNDHEHDHNQSRSNAGLVAAILLIGLILLILLVSNSLGSRRSSGTNVNVQPTTGTNTGQ